MNFPRPEKSYDLCLATGNSSRLRGFVCAESFHYWPMNFPRPGKIIRSLSGRSPGFDGLDGQKAYVMNFHRATKKHLAA